MHRILFFILYAFNFSIFAQTVTVDIRSRPPEIVIKDGQVSGPIKQLIELLFSETDHQLTWLEVPWPRTLSRAMLGQVDIIPRHSINAERLSYLSPMLIGFEKREVVYLLAPKIKNPQSYTSMTQLTSLTFGLLRDSYYSPAIEQIKDKPTTFYANDIEQLVKLLLLNRIDVLPIQNIEWTEYAYDKINREHPGAKYQIAAFKENFISGKYISIAKLSPLHAEFDQVNCRLYKLRERGEIDQIYFKHAITPYLQYFDHIDSKKQQSSCFR